ncbi:MAG TPA: hypothetical protein VLL54_09445 [Pyrinomonadaceae bacterium]|nr:hypothetical protein [Pyrinomonadaceae bacterium]
MKNILVLITFLMTVSMLAFAQAPDKWISYSSPEGRYTVSLPGEPKLTAQEGENANGEKSQQYLAVANEPGDIGYMTAYFDLLPNDEFSIDGARDGMVEELKGVLISETSLPLDRYQGREFQMTLKPTGGTVYLDRVRIYKADKRIYVLQCLFPKSSDGETMRAKAAKYFDSFQIRKN